MSRQQALDVQLIYVIRPQVLPVVAVTLAAAEVLTYPLTGGLIGTATWMQVSHAPPNSLATTRPAVHHRRYIRGFVDTDQASAANGLVIRFSDNASTVRAQATFTIPANTAGNGTTISVTIPGGKYVQVAYTNGAVAATRFCILLNLCES